MTIPFSLPTIGQEEEAAVLEVLRSGWITTGKKCSEFEQLFVDRVGSKHALALTSATAALHLALAVHNIGPGDEVVTPSMNWCSTPNMVRLLGAKPVFVDVFPDTLNIDPEDLQRVMTSRTKAVVPVHFAGRAYDVDAVLEVMKDYSAVLIDDAAHAIGTVYKGQEVGALADLSSFSFHPMKNITTGEGGMLTYDDDALHEKLKLLKFHGVNRDAFSRYRSNDLPHYDVQFPGYKYNLTDIQAALGVVQMRQLDAFNERRSTLAHRYSELLSGLPLLLPPLEERSDCVHAWHLYVVRLQKDIALTREDVMIKLKDSGVSTGLHFLPVHQTTAFSDLTSHLPVTEFVGSQIFSLPLFPGLTFEQQDVIVKAIHDIIGRGSKK